MVQPVRHDGNRHGHHGAVSSPLLGVHEAVAACGACKAQERGMGQPVVMSIVSGYCQWFPAFVENPVFGLDQFYSFIYRTRCPTIESDVDVWRG